MEQQCLFSLHWLLQQEEVQVQVSNSSSNSESWETAYRGTADRCRLQLPQPNCFYHVRLTSQRAQNAEARCRDSTFCRAKQQMIRQRSVRIWLYSEPLLVCSSPLPPVLSGIGTSVVLTWEAPDFACVQRQPVVQVAFLLEQVCSLQTGPATASDSSTCSSDDTVSEERILFSIGARCWFVPSELRADSDYRWRLHTLYSGRLSPPSPWLCHSTALPALQLVESRNCEVILRLPALQSSLHGCSSSRRSTRSSNSRVSSSHGTALTECLSCETTSAASNCTDVSPAAAAVCTVQCLTAEGQWHTVGEPIALRSSCQRIRVQGLRPHTRLRLRACVQVNMPELRKAVLGALQQLEAQPQAACSAAAILDYGLEAAAAAAAQQVTRPATSHGHCRPVARSSSEPRSGTASCAASAAAAATAMTTISSATAAAAGSSGAAVTAAPALYVRDDRQLEQWFASLRRQGAAIIDATCTSEGTSYLDEPVTNTAEDTAAVVVEAGCYSASTDCMTGAAPPHSIAVNKGASVECYAWWQQKHTAAVKQSLSFSVCSLQCDAVSSRVRDGCWGRATLPRTIATAGIVAAQTATEVASLDEITVRLQQQWQRPCTATAETTLRLLQLPVPLIELIGSSSSSSSSNTASESAAAAAHLRVQWSLPAAADSDAAATSAATANKANAANSSSGTGSNMLLLDMSVMPAAASAVSTNSNSAAVTTVWSNSLTDAASLQTVLIPVQQAGATYSFRLRALLPHYTVVGPAVCYTAAAATTVTSADDTITPTTTTAQAAAAADAPLLLRAASAYFLSTAAKRSCAAGSSRRGSLCVKLTWRHVSDDVSTADCMYTVQCSRTTVERAVEAGECWQHVYTGALPECHDAATLGAAHVRARYRVRRVTDTACAEWSEVCAVDMQLAQQQQQQQTDSLMRFNPSPRDSVFQLTALQCDGADATVEHRAPTRPTSAMSSSAALRHSHRLNNCRAAAAAAAAAHAKQQQHSKAHTPQCCGVTTADAPAKLLLALQQTLGEQWGADYAQMLCSSTANSTETSGKCSSSSSARFDWSAVSVDVVDQLLHAAVDSKRCGGHCSTTAACALKQQQQKQPQQQQQPVTIKLSAQRPASATTSPATSASCTSNSRAAGPQRARELLQQRVVLLAERVYCRQPRRAQSAGAAACRSAR
jgi:hypothetical protein